MKTDLVFKASISKLRRRIILRWVEQVLLTTLLFGLFLNTIAIGLQKFGAFEWEGHAVYLLLLALALALSLIYISRRKGSFQDALIEIDIRLGLKDRLSTAYEYHQFDRRSLFMDRLTAEANGLLASLRGSQIVPKHFSSIHLLIPFFTILLTLLIFVDWSPRTAEVGQASMERLKQIGVELERYAERVRPNASEAVNESQKKFSEQMDAVARTLQAGAMSQRKLLKSLDRFTHQSELERRRLTERLNEELSLGDSSQTPALESLQMGEPTSAEISQLQEGLEDMFEGKVPASISNDLSNLALHNEMTEYFVKTMETLGVPLKEDELQDGGKSLLAGRASENLVITGDASDMNIETGSGSIPRPRQTRKGDTEASDDRLPEDEESVFTAGGEKAKGDKKAPYDLERPETPVSKDKGVSGRGDRYTAYVRSLPAIGRAALKEQDIMTAYRKELENVIRREEVPPPYREYIKQYFLSIGLGKETEDNGDPP